MITDDQYRRTVGDELRALRKRRGWTRKQLAARLPNGFALQTLASYEQGTRALVVSRLHELCRALDGRPSDVLARVEHRLYGYPGVLWMDLATLAATSGKTLEPARAWARIQLGQPDAEHVVAMTYDAVAALAAVCGITIDDLYTALSDVVVRPVNPRP